MVYCVTFADVVQDLQTKRFEHLGNSEGNEVFYRSDGAIVVIHAPNQNGGVPESLVNDAMMQRKFLLPTGT